MFSYVPLVAQVLVVSQLLFIIVTILLFLLTTIIKLAFYYSCLLYDASRIRAHWKGVHTNFTVYLIYAFTDEPFSVINSVTTHESVGVYRFTDLLRLPLD